MADDDIDIYGDDFDYDNAGPIGDMVGPRLLYLLLGIGLPVFLRPTTLWPSMTRTVARALDKIRLAHIHPNLKR